MNEAPSPWREIAKAAWLVTKIILGGIAVMAPIGALMIHHPVAGLMVMYGLVFAIMIGLFGWQNYREKVRRHAETIRDREAK